MSDRAKSWLKRVEINLCNRVDGVVAVSELDRALLVASGVRPEQVVVIPHGVDLSLYDQLYDFDLRRQYDLDRDLPLLVYHGIYSYQPNLEAVRLIAEELLPRLARRGYRTKVLAIGRNPPQEPVHEDVLFTGPVPNLAPYLKKVDLAVIPLQKGGGTRMKILEYFAAGVPVIATSKAIEGIPIENGVQAWIEDDFEAMADAIVTLLEDRPGLPDWRLPPGRTCAISTGPPSPGLSGAGRVGPHAERRRCGRSWPGDKAPAGRQAGSTSVRRRKEGGTVAEEGMAPRVDAMDIDTILSSIVGLPSDWHAAGTLGGEVILAIYETLRERGLVGTGFQPRPAAARAPCFSRISACGTIVLLLALVTTVWNG